MKKDTINVFAISPCEFPFNIEVSGISDCDEFYITQRNNSHCYIIEFIARGSGVLICDGKKYEINENDVYLLRKGSNHKYYPDREKPWKKVWFNIDGILVPTLITSYGLQNSVVFKYYKNGHLFDEMYNLTRQRKPKQEIMLEASILFHKIISSLYELETASNVKSSINAIKDFLDANIYRGDFSLSEVADTLCFSKSYIISKFKQEYNQTPHQYLISQRIQIAKSMLLNTQMSINQISDTLNFTDQHYFTRVFKKIVGITPSNFKKECLNKNINKYNELTDQISE